MVLPSTSEWIESSIIPRIINICVQKGYVVNDYSVVPLQGMKDNFASVLLEINVSVQNSGESNIIHFLLKIMLEDEIVRSLADCEKQFFNEIHFYSAVLPQFLDRLNPETRLKFESLFPKCIFHILNGNPIPKTLYDAAIVMENLKPSNFTLGHKMSLDFKHCAVALRSLGMFHALSFFMKKQKPEEFKKLMSLIQDIHYNDIYSKYLAAAQTRVMNCLAREFSEEHPSICRLRQIAQRKISDVLKECKSGEEPFAVLCHGDYLRNNILFRQNEDESVEIKIIDFQKMFYSSPAVDVSHFICMSVSHELRSSRFEDLLRVYHDSLTKYTLELCREGGCEPDVQYSFAQLQNDIRRYSPFGFILACCFIPSLFLTEEEQAEMVALWTNDPESPVVLALQETMGGKPASTAITNLAKDLIQRNFL